jgi:thymidine kinase
MKTLEFIQGESLNAVVLIPAYNATLLKKCMNAGFEENILQFVKKAQEKGVKVASFAALIDEKYFLDDMHLNAEGNKQFADLINKEIKQ